MIISFWITQVAHFNNLIPNCRQRCIDMNPGTLPSSLSLPLGQQHLVGHWRGHTALSEGRILKGTSRSRRDQVLLTLKWEVPVIILQNCPTFDLEAVTLNLKQDLSPSCGMVQALERITAETLHKFKASKGCSVRLHPLKSIVIVNMTIMSRKRNSHVLY